MGGRRSPAHACAISAGRSGASLAGPDFEPRLPARARRPSNGTTILCGLRTQPLQARQRATKFNMTLRASLGARRWEAKGPTCGSSMLRTRLSSPATRRRRPLTTSILSDGVTLCVCWAMALFEALPLGASSSFSPSSFQALPSWCVFQLFTKLI